MYPNGNSGIGSKMLTAIIDNATIANPTTGRVFFVAKAALANISEIKSIVGTSYPDGTPMVFTTIALAVAQCVAARGDVILVAPGHTESIVDNATLTMSISGVSVIGLGSGSQRPVITLDTANTATINVTAAGVGFKNCIFIANFLNVAALFTLTTAKDFQLRNCDIKDTDSTHNFVAMVVIATTANAADGMLIDGNKFLLAIATGATKLVSFLGACDRVTITNNYYSTPTTGTGAVLPVATGKALTNLIMDGNKFNLVQTAGTSTGILITSDTTGSGYVSNNLVQTAATTPLCVTAGRGFVQTNNLFTHTADKSGYVMPTIDASS